MKAYLPKKHLVLGLTKIIIEEHGTPVWKDGSFQPYDGGFRVGADGVHAGRLDDDYVTFDVGSGFYRFQLKGS